MQVLDDIQAVLCHAHMCKVKSPMVIVSIVSGFLKYWARVYKMMQ
jgi:hypothetical protein